jgi:hypothetical protein
MSTLFPETLARVRYLIRFVIWSGIFLVVSALLFPMVKVFGIPDWLPFIIVVPLFLMRFPCLDIPRCRDMGWSPWRLLLLLVPIANFIMVLSLFVWPSQGDDA